jgi:hypothetical protein
MGDILIERVRFRQIGPARVAVKYARAAALAVFASVTLVATTACGGSSDDGPDNTMRLSFDGTVRNANTTAPIANATVMTGSYTLIPGTTEPGSYIPRVTTTTDAQGRFTIDDQCMSNNYLEARAAGYETLVTAVACAPSRRTMPIALIPGP